MTSAKRGIKKSQKEQDVAEDQFLEQGRVVVAWLEAHVPHVGAAIVLVLGAVLALEFAEGVSDRKDSAATAALADAVEAYEKSVEPSVVLTSTSADTVESGYARARKALASVAKDFEEHPAARLAQLYEGDLYLRSQKYELAEPLLNAYVDTARADDPLLLFAVEKLGYAFEGAGKLDEALGAFERLISGPAYYRDYGWKHKARVLEKKGDRAGAQAAYQAIADMDPPSDLKSFAEARLKSLAK
ncbi:MAG: hypothetical protein IPK13_20080 [Deltaproteobacteria bacterium]|nr:hypothetical protein [Deltaproteobacteria bacterium]